MLKRAVKILAFFIIPVLILIGAFTGDRETVRLDKMLLKPSLEYPFGTDHLGRDILPRLCFAVVLSAVTSVTSWVMIVFLGLMIGGIAALSPGFVSRLILTMITLVFVTPFILILIAFSSIVGAGVLNSYLILVLFWWAIPARYSYFIVNDLKRSRFAIAARSFGFTTYQIILFAMIQRVIKPVVASSLPLLPDVIALDAGLSMLGLGAQPPTPTLGSMLYDGVKFAYISWHPVIFPLMSLILLVFVSRKIIEKVNRGWKNDGK